MKDYSICFYMFISKVLALLNPTLHGGGTECPPHQLWSLVALSRRFGLVQFQCTFGHMDALSALSTKKVLKIVFELV